MTIEITDLTQLNAADVAAATTQAVTRVQELHPTLDLKRGPVHDLVLVPHAVFAAAQQANLDRYLGARSLLDINADPSLADPGIVDGILSNFLISRRGSATASGSVTIVVSQPTTVTIAVGAIFSANGYLYTSPRVYTAKAEAEQLNGPGDALLTPLADGTYAFTVVLDAVDAGTAPSLRKDTALIPESPPVIFVRAYATADFTGGLDAESNVDLINRLLPGLAAKAPGNRSNITAMLRNDTVLGSFQSLSVIGYGDPEMLRDKHSLFPVSGGGRSDLYFRLEGPVRHLGLTVTATLISTSSLGGVWQFSLDRDTAPGFYEVRNIRPNSSALTSGGYAVLQDTRALDLSGSGWRPDVQGLVEGAYSRFQVAVLNFRDPNTPVATSPGTQASYLIEVVYSAGIDDLQDRILSDRQFRPYGSDTLAKAPVPCFVRIGLNIYKTVLDPTPDTVSIAQAIAANVNKVGFTGRLFASTLLEAAGPYLGGGVAAFDMLGRLRFPSGVSRVLRNPTLLTVPDLPGEGVTAQTVQFFCDPENVGVQVTDAVPSV